MQNKNLRQSYGELQSVVASLRNQLNVLNQAYASTSRVLAAVVSLLGESTVQEEMDRVEREQQRAQDEQMAEGTKVLVHAGVLKPIAETTIGALVIGMDLDAAGKTRRVHFELKTGVVPDEILPKFLGKKVGDVVENNNVKMTVTEIYDIDRARAAEFQAEEAKKAQEAANPQVIKAYERTQAVEASTPEEAEAKMMAEAEAIARKADSDMRDNT